MTVRVLAAQATSPTTIRVGFDGAVEVLDASAITFRRIDLPAVALTTHGATAADRAVVVEVDLEMTPDVQYELAVAGVQALDGSGIDPSSDRVTFTGFRSPRPTNRRFDLWSMIPKYNRREDSTGDLRRFLSCLQEVTDLLLADLDRFADLFDLERAPEPFLDAILADLGNPFGFELDVLGKRRLASVLVEMYRQKGTAPGIKNAVRFFMQLEIEIVAYLGEGLILGESELGVDWILGPSTRFARYAFDVIVPRVLSDTERRQLRALITYAKPAHTHFVNLIEPLPPLFIDHWLLGVSELGVNTDLH